MADNVLIPFICDGPCSERMKYYRILWMYGDPNVDLAERIRETIGVGVYRLKINTRQDQSTDDFCDMGMYCVGCQTEEQLAQLLLMI